MGPRIQQRNSGIGEVIQSLLRSPVGVQRYERHPETLFAPKFRELDQMKSMIQKKKSLPIPIIHIIHIPFMSIPIPKKNQRSPTDFQVEIPVSTRSSLYCWETGRCSFIRLCDSGCVKDGSSAWADNRGLCTLQLRKLWNH